jgi:hypothetical protein
MRSHLHRGTSPDFNGWYLADIVLENADRRLKAQLMNSAGEQSLPMIGGPEAALWHGRRGNLDGNSYPDLVFQHETDRRVAVWLVNRRPTFKAACCTSRQGQR